MSICTVDDCTRDARKRGWCSKHYQRWLRHGNTDSVHDVGRKPEPALWVVTCPDCEATVGVVGHQAGAWDVMARHLCNINERKSSMTRYIYTAAYITVIVAANWATSTFGLVPIGFGLAVTAGTFFAGLALIVRDGLQLQVGRAWMLSAIAAGALISAVTSEPAIAFGPDTNAPKLRRWISAPTSHLLWAVTT